jgi:hypothetical protein
MHFIMADQDTAYAFQYVWTGLPRRELRSWFRFESELAALHACDRDIEAMPDQSCGAGLGALLRPRL